MCTLKIVSPYFQTFRGPWSLYVEPKYLINAIIEVVFTQPFQYRKKLKLMKKRRCIDLDMNNYVNICRLMNQYYSFINQIIKLFFIWIKLGRCFQYKFNVKNFNVCIKIYIWKWRLILNTYRKFASINARALLINFLGFWVCYKMCF